MPVAGENFLSFFVAFLYKKHVSECILKCFSHKNAPKISKIPPAAVYAIEVYANVSDLATNQARAAVNHKRYCVRPNERVQ